MATFAGRKLGDLYIMRPAKSRSWVCICTCGREATVRQATIAKHKCTHQGPKKRHPVYMIWKGMKSRCYTESDTSYPRYGAKGIRVDPEWHDFYTFFRDIGHTWRQGLSLDREDGTKNYGPNNCRWATVQEQNNNRSVNYEIEMDGNIFTLQQLVDHFGVVSYKTAHSRITKLGWDEIRAASTPGK